MCSCALDSKWWPVLCTTQTSPHGLFQRSCLPIWCATSTPSRLLRRPAAGRRSWCRAKCAPPDGELLGCSRVGLAASGAAKGGPWCSAPKCEPCCGLLGHDCICICWACRALHCAYVCKPRNAFGCARHQHMACLRQDALATGTLSPSADCSWWGWHLLMGIYTMQHGQAPVPIA